MRSKEVLGGDRVNPTIFRAGAISVDITPQTSLHLAGYPHVKRHSAGTHDPLLSSALYVESAGQRAIFVANDIIYVTKALVARARRRVEETTGVPASNILISATHTHSGPKMLDPIATSGDLTIPKAD